MAKALLGFERIFLGSPKQSQYALARRARSGRALGLFDDAVFIGPLHAAAHWTWPT